jgi:hypothetical protein
LIGLLPPIIAAIIASIFFGNDDSYTSALAHSLVAFLTPPGFIALEFGRLILRRGNLHGDRWDLLSIPLSMMIVVLILKLNHYAKSKGHHHKL